MKILIIGSGGRESAFAYKISQSKRLEKLYIAPGNPGTAQYGENVEINVNEFDKLADFAKKEKVDIVVVGPEEPLVKGLHDFFSTRDDLKHIGIVGPKKAAAQLEGSKDFSKKFMMRHGIPTANYASFTAENFEEGLAFIEKQNLPVVLKASGLAAGKGVLICETREDAKTSFKEMILNKKFGEASSTVVVEEFLSGIELSVFVLTDGNSYKILPTAKDYKRIGEGDTGLNTGGMGAVSPVPFADPVLMQKIEDRIIKPTISGLKKDNLPYRGFIFLGLMNVEGNPYLIEYNVRMGDPETQSVLTRIESDIVDLLEGVVKGDLENREYTVSPKTAATVVCVSAGYPGNYLKGDVINNMENVEDSIVFQAGTAVKDGEIVTAGGRVLSVTSLQDTLFEALQQSTADAGRIFYKGKNFRKDIGFDLI